MLLPLLVFAMNCYSLALVQRGACPGMDDAPHHDSGRRLQLTPRGKEVAAALKGIRPEKYMPRKKSRGMKF
jgi:hypothetical protein